MMKPPSKPEPEPAHAPERSLREKLALLLLGLLAGLGALWFKQAVLLPWVAELAPPPGERVFRRTRIRRGARARWAGYAHLLPTPLLLALALWGWGQAARWNPTSGAP